MFVNPFLVKIYKGNETILVSLLGGGIQLIPSEISQVLFTNPSLLPERYITHFKDSEILFDNSDRFYNIFNSFKNKSFTKTELEPLNVIFTLTYSCNFSCSYCFQLRQKNPIGDKIISFDFIENAKEIVSQLEAFGNYPKGLSKIYLYGGEPLRNEPHLLKIVDKLLDTFTPSNQIFITTNGYDLNHYKPILERYSNLNIQVTIDGPKFIQDKKRRAKDKGSSFDKILSNLKFVKSLNHNIMIRINVGEDNYLYILDLMNELRDYNIFTDEDLPKHIYLAPVTNRESEEINIAFYKAFIDYYFEYLFRYKIRVSNIRPLDYAIKVAEGETITPSKFYCDAIYGKYIIDPIGNIGICEEAVLNENQFVGNIDKEGKVAIKENPWKDRTVEDMSECINCEYRYMCSGGCPWKASNCTRNYKSAMCDGFKEIFEYSILKLLGEK